jgi:hypothetical protein
VKVSGGRAKGDSEGVNDAHLFGGGQGIKTSDCDTALRNGEDAKCRRWLIPRRCSAASTIMT